MEIYRGYEITKNRQEPGGRWFIRGDFPGKLLGYDTETEAMDAIDQIKREMQLKAGA